MALPSSHPTPVLTGQDARDFLAEMERIERGELTEEEIAFAKKVKESAKTGLRIYGKYIDPMFLQKIIGFE